MQNRREFLKRMTLLGAAATLPMNLRADSTLAPKPVGDGLLAVRYGNEILREKTPRRITVPDVGEFKVLKGDFHIHTLFSDGQVMPRDRVSEAVDNGLDVIAITDHIEYRIFLGGQGRGLKLVENNDDHNIAYNLAKPDAEKSNLILVQGTEITKRMIPPGHLNALFTKDVNPIAAAVDDWKQMLAVAADQGAFIQWNHPGWVEPASGGLEKDVPMRFFDEHEEARSKGHLHGVEVFNGWEVYPVALDWCNERDIAPIANSDIHASEWNNYGHHNPLRPMTLILAKDRSYDSVREAFFAKRTVGWAANLILGRQPWVEQLFRACVEIKTTANGLTLQNRSDIPCLIEVNGSVSDLQAQGTVEIRDASAKKLTVRNWLIGMNKPLELVTDATTRNNTV